MLFRSNEQDLSLLRGAIAEAEGLSPNEIRFAIEPVEKVSATDMGEEIISLIDN